VSARSRSRSATCRLLCAARARSRRRSRGTRRRRRPRPRARAGAAQGCTAGTGRRPGGRSATPRPGLRAGHWPPGRPQVEEGQQALRAAGPAGRHRRHGHADSSSFRGLGTSGGAPAGAPPSRGAVRSRSLSVLGGAGHVMRSTDRPRPRRPPRRGRSARRGGSRCRHLALHLEGVADPGGAYSCRWVSSSRTNDSHRPNAGTTAAGRRARRRPGRGRSAPAWPRPVRPAGGCRAARADAIATGSPARSPRTRRRARAAHRRPGSDEEAALVHHRCGLDDEGSRQGRRSDPHALASAAQRRADSRIPSCSVVPRPPAEEPLGALARPRGRNAPPAGPAVAPQRLGTVTSSAASQRFDDVARRREDAGAESTSDPAGRARPRQQQALDGVVHVDPVASRGHRCELGSRPGQHRPGDVGRSLPAPARARRPWPVGP
jgi:hypothetical protein